MSAAPKAERVPAWSCCCWPSPDGPGESGPPKTSPAQTLEVLEPVRPSEAVSEARQTHGFGSKGGLPEKQVPAQDVQFAARGARTRRWA